jgi:eukaryotic-like serine/threonine-protein kinase
LQDKLKLNLASLPEVMKNGAERGMHELKKCNSCGSIFPSNLSFCLNDGNPLVQPESLIGIVLDGRYRLDGLIGTGGMGDVYRATHVHLDTEFAVKLLKPELVANQTAIKRFRLEAKAAGRIHHPNAIKVTDFGVTPERIVYLVMEIVDGQSVRDLIHHEGAIDHVRTINIVRQVCSAVEAAHRSGVIHRDLKPDNILLEKVTHFERVKVGDFGIAKLKETNPDALLTLAGTLIGTPQYMSPEQCQGRPLDPSSDLYSIGIILYEMLTGVVPFDGDSALQVVVKQLHDPPQPIRELSPNVPASLAQIVMRALEKEPRNRQTSAAEMNEELKKVLEMAGEVEALSFTDQLATLRMPPPSLRTPVDSGVTTDGENKPKSFADDPPPPYDRETALISPSEAVAFERVTRPNDRVTTPQERSIEDVSPTRRRQPFIALATALFVAITAILIYQLLVKDDPPNEDPIPPEGMVLIPGGKFILGGNNVDAQKGSAIEREVRPYFLDKFEVTNQDYKKFVDESQHRAPSHWKSNGSYDPDDAILPVTYVTWQDAKAYASWAKKRLPTEAEWEFAARGGSKGYLYPWGDEWQEGYANVNREGARKPSPVHSFEKDISSFGIFDMAGNVSEWVEDFFTRGYRGEPDHNLRIIRGGNFLSTREESSNTYRLTDHPDEKLPDDVKPLIGFRCAKDIAQK